ncbi:MAG: LysR family transcriptional regulator, partial [Chloroflexota bacterium]
MAQLNVHQLEVFRAVARLGNITRAAVELVISQPAVSEQVKELEIACGMPLLERLPRGVRLTQAGEVVYEYAERLFTAAEQLEQTLAELRSLLRGRLRLGASMTIGQYVLPAVMGAFGEQYPGVRLSLIVGNSSAIVARVVERELGLGFVGGAPTQTGLIVVPYLVDEIVV